MEKPFLMGMTLVLIIIALSSFYALANSNNKINLLASNPRKPFDSSNTKSLNWAGYAINMTPNSFKEVNASWIVPQISCTKQTTYVAIWVGLDGFNDSTVEQTGIMGECKNGKPVYSAWYEFYPNPSVTFNNANVMPGDKIVAWVVYLPNNTFVTVIEEFNSNNGLVFNKSSPPESVSGAEKASAEWIVERPAQCIGISCTLTTLANFGNASFGFDFTNINSDYVTLWNGTSLPFGLLSKYLYNITMVNNNGNPLAYVSYFNGISSFKVSYVTTSSVKVSHGYK